MDVALQFCRVRVLRYKCDSPPVFHIAGFAMVTCIKDTGVTVCVGVTDVCRAVPCPPLEQQCILENGPMTRDQDMECWMTSSSNGLTTYHLRLTFVPPLALYKPVSRINTVLNCSVRCVPLLAKALL